MKTLIAILSCVAISTLGFSQIKTPQPSPGATVKQNLGLSEVTIKYSRPGVKGRTIFGELVPYDKIWRTGANAATTIKFQKDVKIEGKALPAGKYAILTIPGKEEWTIIFSSNTSVSVPRYKQDEDALRITVKPNNYTEKVETFTINCTEVKDNTMNVQLLWENTSVKFSVETDVDSEVMKAIETTMGGPTWRDYYVAAQYYYNNDKDLAKAEQWMNKAVSLTSDKPKFWVIHWQAKILAKNGKKKEAIAAAEKSKQLAQEAKYEEYVKKNDELIKEIKAKK